MSNKMSQTDSVLYTIDRGKGTIDHLLKHDDAEMRTVLRREWLITVGASLDVAKAEVERLRKALARFGAHDEECDVHERGPDTCSCGFDEVRVRP